MASRNKRAVGVRTYEGGPAVTFSPIKELERAVLSCFLWEDTFYEDGVSIAQRIHELVRRCSVEEVAELATKARKGFRLRHAPLWLVLGLLDKKPGKVLADLIYEVVDRPDELTELLSLYWGDGKKPIPFQMKRGLGRAFNKFDEYQLAKYNRKTEVKLADVMKMVHAKPKNVAQNDVFKRLIAGELRTPDTWEVNLSGGKDKKETFTRLLSERKLGYMALLRNLRNMHSVGVDEDLVQSELIRGAKFSKALPFRFIAAAKACPDWEPAIDEAMQLTLENQDKIPGTTVLVVDHSGSMSARVSGKSEINRFDAACGVAILLAGICEKLKVLVFSHETAAVPPRKGFALSDAMHKAVNWGGTWLGAAVTRANVIPHDRMVVITDEQSHDEVGSPKNRGYMVNVAQYQHGVGYGSWIRVNGWSEAVVDWIREYEKSGF